MQLNAMAMKNAGYMPEAIAWLNFSKSADAKVPCRTLWGAFFIIRRSHSISFTRAQGIPKYKIGFGREKDGRVGERLV
jgi:hypothetical protein